MAHDDGPSDDDQSFRSAHSRSPSPPITAPSQTKKDNDTEPTAPSDEPTPLPPDEEARLLSSSADLKATGNTRFGAGAYSDAISVYDRALALVPSYRDYEAAVLRANIAACHLKLEDWQAAVDTASEALDALERLDPVPEVKREEKTDGMRLGKREEEKDEVLEEKDEEKEKKIAEERVRKERLARERLEGSGHTIEEVRKMRVKALIRRAKARTELDGWAALQGADEDYRAVLAAESGAGPAERRTAQGALAALGPRLDDARQREMAEMMGKLKGLGNTLLKPFGLSTENFQFVKDEKTGGYSMNFNQGR